MEFGIFDFYKMFSRAFGEGEDGVWGWGELEWEVWDVVNDRRTASQSLKGIKRMLMIFSSFIFR